MELIMATLKIYLFINVHQIFQNSSNLQETLANFKMLSYNFGEISWPVSKPDSYLQLPEI
jgi:hypothetical protein